MSEGEQGSTVPPSAIHQVDLERVGRYFILRQIGLGGMGVVLVAYDPGLDRKVAIKVLREGVRTQFEGAVRMRREAQAMAKLSHPNVAQIYEVGEVDGRLYLVMEYIKGTTLREWLSERPRTSAETLHTFMEAGPGPAAGPAAGVVHPALQPPKGMVRGGGRGRVLDFGLSRSLLAPSEPAASDSSLPDEDPTITRIGALIGTPAYMSPEQLMRREADARSDQFSFCVALYEALHGQRPFAGRDLSEISANVVDGVLSETPSHVQVPTWLRQVLRRGLHGEPAERWPTMDALLAALARDSQRARRRGLLAGLLAVGIAGASYGAATYQVAWAQLCSGAAEELSGVWDAPRRAALEQVVTATGVGYAASVLAVVTTRLDAYAENWIATHPASCEAHQRGHASAQLYDRRMACLRQRRTELAATVDVLLQTRADGVANLIEAVRLPPVSSCEDDERLQAAVPLPADPSLAAGVGRVRERLARLQALLRGGRYPDVLAEMPGELAEMQRLGDVALLAEGHLLAGKVAGTLRRGGGARAGLDRALELSLEVGLDETAAEALVAQIFQIGVVELRPKEALTLAPLARALVRRVGTPVRLAASLHGNIGVVYMDMGELEQSIESLQRAIDFLDPADDSQQRWFQVNNLVRGLALLGAHERARALGEPLLRRIQQLYDGCHPIAAALRAHLARGRRDEAHFAAAIAEYEESLACFRDGFPSYAVLTLIDLASTAVLSGDDDAARQYLARADALIVQIPGFRSQRADFALLSADIERRAGNHDAARRLLTDERTRVSEEQGAASPDLARIDVRLAILDHIAGDDEAALARLQPAGTKLPDYMRDERGLRAFTLAQVLQALGRGPPEVVSLVREAIDAFSGAGAAYAPPVAEVRDWAASKDVSTAVPPDRSGG